MKFIKLNGNRYMIGNSNGYIVSEEEKLKLEKNELVLNDIKGCECQQEITKKISTINEELKNDTVEETTESAE